MLGALSEYSQQYLIIFSCTTAVLFSLPLFFVPISWAKLIRWTIPEHTHLAIYFGRCLGALALVINFLVYKAASDGIAISLIFNGLTFLLTLMVLVHIYGAVKKIQPITETLEIGFWLLLLILNLCFQPT